MPQEKRQNLAEKDSMRNQEEQLEKCLDDKGAFYNGKEVAIGGVRKNFINFTGKNLCWISFY